MTVASETTSASAISALLRPAASMRRTSLLALGERGERRRLARDGGGQPAPHLVEQLAGDRRREHGVARGDRAHGGDDLLRWARP